MISKLGALAACILALTWGHAWAQDDLGQARPKIQGKAPAVPDAPDVADQAEEEQASNIRCGVPEVDGQDAVNDLFSKKTVLAIYDVSSFSTCPELESLSRQYRGKIAFARVSVRKIKDLGLDSRLGIKGPIPLTHFYLLDGSSKFDFDQASPSSTKYNDVAYRVEEYFQAALWRCMDTPPRDPAPKPVPERVQCFPECPHREGTCEISE